MCELHVQYALREIAFFPTFRRPGYSHRFSLYEVFFFFRFLCAFVVRLNYSLINISIENIQS